jgi:uncharacterized protein YraI
MEALVATAGAKIESVRCGPVDQYPLPETANAGAPAN